MKGVWGTAFDKFPPHFLIFFFHQSMHKVLFLKNHAVHHLHALNELIQYLYIGCKQYLFILCWFLDLSHIKSTLVRHASQIEKIGKFTYTMWQCHMTNIQTRARPSPWQQSMFELTCCTSNCWKIGIKGFILGISMCICN